MEIIYKDVVGYEGLYKVTNTGEIYSYQKQREGYSYLAKRKTSRLYKEIKMKQSFSNNYMIVVLRKDGKYKTCGVHRLVANAFIDNPDKKPIVNHIDFNTKNNRVENLEWCTQYENVHHTMNNNRDKYCSGEENYRAKIKNNQIKDIFSFKKSGMTNKEIAKIYTVNESIISKILNRKTYKNVVL